MRSIPYSVSRLPPEIWFWVHVSSDLTEVDIDSSKLDYAYDDDEET